MDKTLREREADGESLDNCNISNNASGDFLTSFNSVPSKKGFKMTFLNIVSLPKNINEIRHSMTNKHIDLIAFNETRLDSGINDRMVHINNYDLIRKDRSRNGGGVCIFLRNSINYKIRHDLILPELECVCIEVTKPQSRPFLVSTVYRPPIAPPEFFDNLEKLIKAIDDENKEMYILGDLNCDMLRKDNEINTLTMTVKSL